MNLRTIVFRMALIALVLLPIACTHMQSTPNNSRAALEQRIDQLWKARMAKDHRTVYGLTDLTYQQAVTLDQFLQKPGFTVLSYEIKQIDTQGDDAMVEFVFETQKMTMMMKLKMKEKWLFEQGAWRLDLTDMMSKGPFGPWGTGVKKK